MNRLMGQNRESRIKMDSQQGSMDKQIVVDRLTQLSSTKQ